jgi:endonuclease/exonuclease/phosphatase family metal-dependent hydrolase
MALLVRTWNLFHGNTQPPQRRAYLQEMLELVTADGPDVVCLQELPLWALGRLEGWSGMKAVTAVARRSRVWSSEVGRLLTGWNTGLLRSALTGEADAILVTRSLEVSRPRSQVVSRRGLRRIVHGVAVDDVFVANFHISGVAEQLDAAAGFVEAEERVVLAGDANLVPPYRLEGFSAPLPESIDQILVRGLESTPPLRWPDERRRVDGRLLSDHAPVELRVG